jgi:hypothetical protein
MVRNKGQGQQGLNENRKGNLGEDSQNIKTGNREQLDDEQRGGNSGKLGKGSQSRKGSSGKGNQ